MNTSLPLQKRNLLILLIALFASMHNPAFGMQRQRPSEHTPPPAKRRRLTKADRTNSMIFSLCLTCEKTFDTQYKMNQHCIDNAHHQNYVIITRETQHNDSENESGLNPPVEGVTRKTIMRFDEQNDSLIQSRQVATRFIPATTEEEEEEDLMNTVLEFAAQVKKDTPIIPQSSSSSRRRGPKRPIIESEDDSDDAEYEDEDCEEEEEYEEERTRPKLKRGVLKKLYFEDGFFRCKNCTHKYRHKASLSKHFLGNPGHASHSMQKYPKRQTTPYDKEYLRNGIYSCKKCNFNTIDRVIMRAHISHNQTHKTHTLNSTYDTYKREQFYCCFFPGCNKEYKNKSSFHSHFSSHPTHKKYLS